MRKGGGKQKGSAFERQVCKDLSLWVSRGLHKDLFWRSAMSGGRSTVAMKKGERLGAQAGDISSIHELGHAFINQFIVECKFYKSLDYASLIKGKGNLLTFWERVRADGSTYGKMPMLVGKQNNYPIVVCLDSAGTYNLRVRMLVKMHIPDADLHIILWDDFLKTKLTPKRERTRL